MSRKFSAIFFDLDGTIADTAQDLAAPINLMRVARGLPPLPYERLRPFASAGARGLIGSGFGIAKDAPEFPALRDEFLALYEKGMLNQSKLFDGVPALLDHLDAHDLPWGIVSNKVERYVRPILIGLGLGTRSRCAVGGDTTAHPKPHPEPLLHACRVTGGVPANRCMYVGDDLRDIQAGRAAGMFTVAAAYGYCSDQDPPQQWGADAVIQTPSELIALL
jgi:N-acetyl-D-muramate 6-phosphate phosphatase